MEYLRRFFLGVGFAVGLLLLCTLVYFVFYFGLYFIGFVLSQGAVAALLTFVVGLGVLAMFVTDKGDL